MENSLNIAIVTESITAINGVSRTYQRLIEYCQKNNIRAHVYTLGPVRQAERRGSVTIYQFKPTIPLHYYPDLPPYDLKIFSPGVIETFYHHSYDLVHLATPGSLGIAIQRLARRRQIPCVGVFHTQVHEYAYRWALRLNVPLGMQKIIAAMAKGIVWRCVKTFYNRCQLVCAPSQDTKVQLTQGLRVPVYVFQRGVDIELFNPRWRNKQLRHTTKLRALYVGRLSSEKNLDLLVDVFKSKDDCELWIVGDGKERSRLEAELPRARFFGSLTGIALSEVFASADFFIFPSTTDTFGNVIMEAHASGLPTIVTDQGGPAQQVQHGITGYIASATPEGFIQALDTFIAHPQACTTMGSAARQAVIHKSWDAAFESLFHLYKKSK